MKMNSTGTELHPNWRALTTIHLPLKRFVKAGETVPAPAKTRNYEIPGNGEEAREFYEQVLNEEGPQRSQIPKYVQKILNPENTKLKQNSTTSSLPFDKSKFFRCAQNNDIEVLKKFDRQSIEVDCRDDYGWTALMIAACEGAFDAVSYLLNLGSNKDLCDKSGKTALNLARRNGHVKVVHLLENELKTVEKSDNKMEICVPKPFYCDVCQRHFTATSQIEHQTSTVHQFNLKSSLPINKLQCFNISPKNRGLQLMVKQGWDKESGLGPTQSGRLYPLKTVIRKQRTGLGVEQPTARVTHFEPFDVRATQRHGVNPRKKKKPLKNEKVRAWKIERRLRRELS